jgi:hypothetical protein
MADTAATLVEQMVAAGEWPEPELMQAIVAQGEQAVPPLVEVVRREVHGWPEEAPLYHAIGLLSMLPSRQAVPALLDVFAHYDNETLEGLPQALRPFGTDVVEPLLAIIQNSSLAWYARAVATQIAVEATKQEPELRARVTALLRQLLADLVARSETVTGDEVSMASSLVVDLSHLADPQARELIQQALEAGLSEMMNEDDVESWYRQKDRRPKPPAEDWLTEYRRHYRDHQEAERRRAEPPPPPPKPRPTPGSASTRLPLPLPVPSPARVEHRRGRNDPCWCGSGKKYKHCHLPKDRR